MENNQYSYLYYFDYILNLDIFGIKFYPKFLGQKKHKSYLSATISIIFFSLIISDFILEVVDCINNENYQVFKSIEIDKKSNQNFSNFTITLCPYYFLDNEAYDFSNTLNESDITNNSCILYNFNDVKFKYDNESEKNTYKIKFSVNKTLLNNIPALNVIFNQHYINEKNFHNPIFASQKSINIPLIKDKDYHIYFQGIKIVKNRKGKIFSYIFSNKITEKSVAFYNSYTTSDKNYFLSLDEDVSHYIIYLHFTGEINVYYFTIKSVEQLVNRFGGFSFFWYYFFKIICKKIINKNYFYKNKRKQINNFSAENIKKVENYTKNKRDDFDYDNELSPNICLFKSYNSENFSIGPNRSPNISSLKFYKFPKSSCSSKVRESRFYKSNNQDIHIEQEEPSMKETRIKKNKSFFPNRQMIKYLGVPCSPIRHLSPLSLSISNNLKFNSLSNDINKNNNLSNQEVNIIKKNNIPASILSIDNAKKRVMLSIDKYKNDTSHLPLNEGTNVNLINIYNRDNLRRMSINKIKNKEESQSYNSKMSSKNKENIQSKINVYSPTNTLKKINEDNEFNEVMDWINIYSTMKELKILELLLLNEYNSNLFFSAKSKILDLEKLSYEMEIKSSTKNLFSDMNRKLQLLKEVSS